MDRSLLKFHSAIKSEATKKVYNRNLNYFLKFVNIKEANGLLQLKDSALQEMVEDYVISLKNKGLRTSSINGRVVALELFFAMNDKVLNFKKIKKMYPARTKALGGRSWETSEIKAMLDYTSSKRNRAIIHVIASTGMRIGGLVGLKLKHLLEMPDNCKIVTVYSGEIEEYVTFLTPEASKAIEDYLEERRKSGEYLNPESPLFRTKYRIGSAKARNMSLGSYQMCIREIVHKIRGVGDGRRTEVAMFHGFRKRFNTILKNNKEINIAIAEKLMGHNTKLIPLDTVYHTPNKEILFGEFKKAIADLTMDDSERLRYQNKIKDEKIKDLETEKDKEIERLKQQQRETQEQIKGLYELLGKD